MPDLLEVGRVGKPHGVRGDTYVSFTSDVASRHEPGSVLFVETPAGRRELLVERSRPEKDRFVVHFAGVDDRTDAEKLTNKTLLAVPVQDDDALWVHELIGSQVVDTSGAAIGTCVAVIENPAHEILELDNGALVPMPFVVSCRDGITTVDPPAGLFELND